MPINNVENQFNTTLRIPLSSWGAPWRNAWRNEILKSFFEINEEEENIMVKKTLAEQIDEEILIEIKSKTFKSKNGNKIKVL